MCLSVLSAADHVFDIGAIYLLITAADGRGYSGPKETPLPPPAAATTTTTTTTTTTNITSTTDVSRRKLALQKLPMNIC